MILAHISHHLHAKHWCCKARRNVNDNGSDPYGDTGVVGAVL